MSEGEDTISVAGEGYTYSQEVLGRLGGSIGLQCSGDSLLLGNKYDTCAF